MILDAVLLLALGSVSRAAADLAEGAGRPANHATEGGVERMLSNRGEGTIEAAGKKSRKAYDYFQVNTANK